jgi:hypothetical protein
MGHDLLGHDLPTVFAGDLLQQLAATSRYPATQNPPAILRAPH